MAEKDSKDEPNDSMNTVSLQETKSTQLDAVEDVCHHACVQQMPLFVHLAEDEFNQQQEELIANIQYSHSEYIDLNSSFHLGSMTTLLLFLLLTF